MDGNELVLERAEGVWIYDETGKRYLDASAGLWYCNVGHGRGALADIAAGQMRRLATYQLFDVFAHRPALELADRVCELSPTGPGSAAFFTSGGSDAVDSAAKIARRYWTAMGRPERRIIITREGGYHGVNAYGTSLSGIEANAAGWGPLVTDVVHVPRRDVAALERALEQHDGHVAAFIGEPVQGAAGVHPPAPEYWEAVQDLCRAHDVLVVADEVVTGFGRLGCWFGSERYGIEPDMVCGAKGITSGYMPLGLVVANQRVREVLWGANAGPLRHGYTYSGHATACAVALGNLDILESEGLVGRVGELEPVLEAEIRTLVDNPLVGEVRTVGLLAGVEIAEAARAADPRIVERIVRAARERGVLVRNLLAQTLQISPPFVIEPDEVALVAQTLRESLDAVQAPEPG